MAGLKCKFNPAPHKFAIVTDAFCFHLFPVDVVFGWELKQRKCLRVSENRMHLSWPGLYLSHPYRERQPSRCILRRYFSRRSVVLIRERFQVGRPGVRRLHRHDVRHPRLRPAPIQVSPLSRLGPLQFRGCDSGCGGRSSWSSSTCWPRCRR